MYSGLVRRLLLLPHYISRFARRSSAFAAGHCYEPFVKYGNLTSSDATWAVGTVVEFACDPGYTLEQGSVSIECMDPDNPQWNETEPACRGQYNPFFALFNSQLQRAESSVRPKYP